MQALFVGVDFEDFDSELVSENARVLEKRLATVKGVYVCAAYADTMNTYECFAGLALGLSFFDFPEFSWGFQLDRSHDGCQVS